jgi:hypothetical protein
VPPEAACMPFRAPLAEGALLVAPLAAAGDPCAWVCVVCAGEFCDENLELMLFIHEFRREPVLTSGGVVPLAFFSVLPRPSNTGRFGAIFCGGVVVAVAAAATGGRGGDAGRVAAGVGCWICSSARGLVGMPPCDDVFGGASLVRPGDEGACWRW